VISDTGGAGGRENEEVQVELVVVKLDTCAARGGGRREIRRRWLILKEKALGEMVDALAACRTNDITVPTPTRAPSCNIMPHTCAYTHDGANSGGLLMHRSMQSCAESCLCL
jgi:hypothetical protein